ncbi:Uncharacterised protein [Burkholderia pseudomallei]|nr:Uncharacterised protein [Burkholderia pseudomallei]CAJ5110607.1 Uncharacterised protein [Burkholderia pseudomallei]CAJ7287591.1 Uncharacterised protein [Burkholderia pseudomallei]CAK0257458.1 Uncharacterised protein [Burkholderia pseudomallei]VCA70067.1 Uncharacterised protein [Burkholderia pseudomallei]
MNRHWPSIRRIKLADNRRGVVIGSIESASAAALGSTHAASASPSRRRPASPRIESTGAGHAASRTPHVACRVSRAAHRRDAPPARHTQARVRGGPSARRPGRVPERRDIGRPHRGAPLFHPTTRMNVSTSAICPMSIGSRSDVDHPAASGARCPKTSIRHLPPAHEATRAARAAHACAHMDSPARARGELRACRAPRARPPCRSSSRRAGRSAPAAPRRARRRRPRAASPCLARPIRSCPSGRPDKRPRSDRG